MSENTRPHGLEASAAPALDDYLPYLMNRVVARINHNLARKLRRRKLSFQHWRVLLVLNARGPRRIGQLAEHTVIPQSTLSRLVDRMERDGLVEKREGLADSRMVEVAATAAGRTTFAAILPLAEEEHRRIAAELDAEQERALVETLKRMLAALQ